MQRQASSQAPSTLGNTPNFNIDSYDGKPYSDTLVDASVTVYPIHIDQGSSNFLGEDHKGYYTPCAM